MLDYLLSVALKAQPPVLFVANTENTTPIALSCLGSISKNDGKPIAYSPSFYLDYQQKYAFIYDEKDYKISGKSFQLNITPSQLFLELKTSTTLSSASRRITINRSTLEVEDTTLVESTSLYFGTTNVITFKGFYVCSVIPVPKIFSGLQKKI
jgi:hypothetical protein